MRTGSAARDAHRARTRRTAPCRPGESNAEIAKVLSLSPATVRTYISRILGKLHARDRTELVVIAHRSGLGDEGHGEPLRCVGRGRGAENNTAATEIDVLAGPAPCRRGRCPRCVQPRRP